MADSGSFWLRRRARTLSLRRVRNLLAVAVLTGAVPLLASPAAAQCDPAYGCGPSSTVPTTPPPSCSLAVELVTGGQVTNATVDNAPAGAPIQITMDGVPAGGGAADASGHATVAFTVPEGIEPGTHPVFAIGAAFSASCGSVLVAGVLGNVINNPRPGADGATVGSEDVSRGGGALARTGIEVALLLAIAGALLLVGRRLVAFERRRRRRKARHDNTIVDLADHTSAARS
jgi:hypothetical protein